MDLKTCMSALLNCGTGIEPVHEGRSDEGQGEVHQHHNRQGFNGAASLVERGVGNRHQLGVADGHGQRRVLGQVEVLAGQRWNDHAHGLRQLNEAQLLGALQA